MEKTVLKNGLTVITNNDSNAKTVTLSYAARVGSYNEDRENMGIAHFTEHMLFKGTTNRATQEINQAIEGIGGILNASTSFEVTQYYCTVPAEQWKVGADVMSDLVWNNLIPEDEFEREKSVVLEELKMYHDDPQSRCGESLFIVMHPSYRNRQYIGGTADTVKKIDRQQMIDFIDKFYTPQNMFVVATGNINHNELVQFLENYCAGVELKQEQTIETQEFVPDKLNGKTEITKMDVNQSHLCWGLFGPPPTDPDFIVSEVVCCLLGGNSSSRLYQIIREQRGLAYTVSMDAEILKDTSILNGYVGLDGNNITSVKQVVVDEFNKLKTEAVTPEELERTKAFLKGTTLIRFERTSSQTNHIISSLILNIDPDVEKYLQEIESVTAEQVKAFADKYFTNENICYTQVVPHSFKEAVPNKVKSNKNKN